MAATGIFIWEGCSARCLEDGCPPVGSAGAIAIFPAGLNPGDAGVKSSLVHISAEDTTRPIVLLWKDTSKSLGAFRSQFWTHPMFSCSTVHEPASLWNFLFCRYFESNENYSPMPIYTSSLRKFCDSRCRTRLPNLCLHHLLPPRVSGHMKNIQGSALVWNIIVHL